MSADGRAVVFHDWNLLRLTGFDARVEIRQVPRKSQACGSPAAANESPCLRTSSISSEDDRPLIIEIKNRKRPCALEPAVSRILRNYRGDVAIHSFNPFSLGWFRRNHPRPLSRSDFLLLRHRRHGWLEEDHPCALRNELDEPPAIHLSPLEAVARNHARVAPPAPSRVPLLTWTVRSDKNKPPRCAYADNVFFETYIPDTGTLPTIASTV